MERDEKGQWLPGESGNPRGRPVFSIVSIIKDELQSVPEGQQEPLIRQIIREYIADARIRNDGTAIRDIIDRFDGKPKQHIAVSDDRQEAWRELQREAFVQSKTEQDMDALPEEDESAEAVDTGRRGTFGEDLA